jgi:hypothetical protein
MITREQFKQIFKNMLAEAESDLERLLAATGLFLRATYTALAHDPVMTAAIKAGMGKAIDDVAAAIEKDGSHALPAAALSAAKDLVITAGGTAAHQLVPIVAGELHAAVASAVAAVPEHINP